MKLQLKSEFVMKNHGKVKKILCMEIKRDRMKEIVFVSVTIFIEDIE